MYRQFRIVALLIALIGVLPICHAQQTHTVAFSYDLDGNRILRQIVIGGGKGVYYSDKSQIQLTDIFETLSVSLYPNPTEGRFSVKVNSLEKSDILCAKVTTVTGVIICEKTFSNQNEDFDLTQQPPGIYLLQLTDGKEIHEWKIIKK